MNLYDIATIEKTIEIISQNQDGELTEEQWKDLVEAQLSGERQVFSLVSYIRHLDQFIGDAKEEKRRISELQERAEKRMESIKRYMLPYVEIHGKIESGTFKVSLRKSSRVDLEENFNDPEYCEIIVSYKPDKAKIKDAIKAGKIVKGAKLLQYNTLQIK